MAKRIQQNKTETVYLNKINLSEILAITGIDALRPHGVVMDSVWEESIQPLKEQPKKQEIPAKSSQAEEITITKDDRSKVREDVRVSVRKLKTQEKEEAKVRRFKIDESRDIHGVEKLKEPAKEKRIIKEKQKKDAEHKQNAGPAEKPRMEPIEDKSRPLKEKQTQTKERVDERDKKLAYYEKKERERLERAYQKRRYQEERYQMKRASSDPWIKVRKDDEPQLGEVIATQVIDDDPRRYSIRVAIITVAKHFTKLIQSS